MRKRTWRELNEYLHKSEDNLKKELDINIYENIKNLEKKINYKIDKLQDSRVHISQFGTLRSELNEVCGIIMELQDSVKELSNRGSKDLHSLYYKELSDIEEDTLIMASENQLKWFPVMFFNSGNFRLVNNKRDFRYFRKLTPEEKEEFIK